MISEAIAKFATGVDRFQRGRIEELLAAREDTEAGLMADFGRGLASKAVAAN
jgi:hypothetical protein